LERSFFFKGVPCAAHGARKQALVHCFKGRFQCVERKFHAFGKVSSKGKPTLSIVQASAFRHLGGDLRSVWIVCERVTLQGRTEQAPGCPVYCLWRCWNTPVCHEVDRWGVDTGRARIYTTSQRYGFGA